MPRDDLTIDFVKKMPQAEPLDPALILDDWTNRVQNLPEEIRFMQDEIADKDRLYHECIRSIEDRDDKIQKWIKSNGSLELNPKEDILRNQIREYYARADELSREKIALAQRMQVILDKHIRSLDVQVKLLYDRGEPSFTDPDEVPSLLRPSAANHAAPSDRSVNPAAGATAGAGTLSGPISSPSNPAVNASNAYTTRLPAHQQIRIAQAQQAYSLHAASAPATPATGIVPSRQRETSAGPATKRGPRSNAGPANAPTASSGLSRHSSLGPGTPKSGPAAGPVGSIARAGSVGPRAGSVKGASGSGSRRGTPTTAPRKKTAHKSSLSRVKKVSARNSPVSTADSDLSEAESVSADDEDVHEARSRGTPAVDSKNTNVDEVVGDAEDDEEEGGDDKKYCLCNTVSYDNNNRGWMLKFIGQPGTMSTR
ncbi:hypothetical protein L249_7374 [Ophiocordyceps polyrhachis-furcata BCC 54312]|uniref:Inhibitor of growth protein N-terminal histone-binding domain-containing protein n=1 Tax=Ophiocordyceps polyrhachis-furcata BCC 54312 TaxID=1330021 RepID=A0A367LBL5_9HYPO|nr:hypothetical protein L249_7374 [Ophiocordyceps polyrhachis-furcata BCC 54312]